MVICSPKKHTDVLVQNRIPYIVDSLLLVSTGVTNNTGKGVGDW